MRIAFSRFQSVLPVICGPRTKAGAIAAHGLRNTRTGRQGQAGRQARRAAAGFNIPSADHGDQHFVAEHPLRLGPKDPHSKSLNVVRVFG
jgi:hypothetical protein